jgi:hypothetical protein
MSGDMDRDAFAHMKRDSTSTWELIVLPAKPFWPCVPARACFLCGDCCTNFRDVVCDDVDEWLLQQTSLSDGCMHQAMQNMVLQARSSQVLHDNSVAPFVAVCLSCDNYLRTHRGMTFFSGVQMLQWHMNTLEEPRGVKIDKRMLYGLCVRLARVHAGKTNYYMTLFSSEEQETIAAIAKNRHNTQHAQQLLLQYFRLTNKNSSLLTSACIAHKMRQCRFPAGHPHGPNVYEMHMWKAE